MLKSCAKLILCGEYNLLQNGFGISLALNRYNTLSYEKSKSLEWHSPFNYLDWINPFLNKLNITSGKFYNTIDWELTNGWGTSGSTLANLCKFTKSNPNKFRELYVKGSGIDFFTSYNNRSLLYRNNSVQPISLQFSFKEYLYFLPLNKKIKSPTHINRKINTKELNSIVLKISSTQDINEFIKLLEAHDNIVSKELDITKIQPLKNSLYSKYLGTWGGDTALLIGEDLEKTYANIIKYKDIVMEEIC